MADNMYFKKSAVGISQQSFYKSYFQISLAIETISGFRIRNFSISRLVAPEVFRSPECFSSNAHNILGESFDLWSYGLLVLNLLTRDYFSIKTYRMLENVSWCKDLWPILNKVLKVRLKAFVFLSVYAKSQSTFIILLQNIFLSLWYFTL